MEPSVEPGFVGEERHRRLRHLAEVYEAVRLSGQSRLVVLTGPTGWGKTRIVQELYAELARSTDGQYWPPRLDADGGSWLQTRKRVFPAPFEVPDNASIPFLWLGVSCQRDQMGRELAALQYAEHQFRAHVGPLAAALANSTDRWKARLSAVGAVAGLFGLPDPVTLAMTWHGVATSGWKVISGEWRTYRDRSAGAKARRVDTQHGPGSAERAAELAEQLARMSGEDLPVVLVIDDAHWADPGTVAFIGKLLNTPGHVLVVATAWPDQLALQVGQLDTFGHTLQAWVEAERAERHELVRLPDAALARVVQQAARDVHPEVLRALCERADGNPNRLQGLMSLRVVRRALAEGGSSLTREQVEALPAGDREIILAIWRDLPDHVREVLALSTLQGPEFNPEWIPVAAELLSLTNAESGLMQAQSPWGWVRAVDAALAAFAETGLFERAAEESAGLFLPDEMAQARAAMLRWAADQKRRPDWDTLSEAARRAVLETHFLGAEQGFLVIDADVADSAHRLMRHLEDREELKRWRQVAERGVEWTEGKPELGDLHRAFRKNVADAVGTQGDYQGALERYEALLSDHGRDGDRNDDAHLELRHGHAWLLMRTGRADAAVTELDDLVATWESRYGDRHELPLRARRRRGIALVAANRAWEAIAEFDRLIELLEAAGAEEGEVLHARFCRADALGEAWRTQAAVSELEAVLEGEIRRVGRDHPDTLHVRNNLGHWLMVRGRNEEARKIFEDLVADRLQIVGPDHPGTLISRGNLASAHAHLRDFHRSEELFRQLLKDQRRVLGPDHPSTIGTQSNLAFMLQDAGRLEEALLEMRSLLEDRERVSGEDDPWTIRTRMSVAALLVDTGRRDEAVGLLWTLTEDTPRVLGWDHRITLQAHARLAAQLRNSGRSSEALGVLNTILDAREKSLGPEHVDTLLARRERAAWMLETARGERSAAGVREALAEIDQVLLVHEDTLAGNHPLTIQVREVRSTALDALRTDGWDPEAGHFR